VVGLIVITGQLNRNHRAEETDYAPHSEASLKMETDPVSETPSLTKISKTINYNMIANLFLNNQPDALINQIYSLIKLYMFRASTLPIIRSFLLYIRHW
jgi:hypothetical protein